MNQPTNHETTPNRPVITRAKADEFLTEFNQKAQTHGIALELVGSIQTNGFSHHDIDAKFVILDASRYEDFTEDMSVTEYTIRQMGGKLAYDNPGYECYLWQGITVDVFYEAETPA